MAERAEEPQGPNSYESQRVLSFYNQTSAVPSGSYSAVMPKLRRLRLNL